MTSWSVGCNVTLTDGGSPRRTAALLATAKSVTSRVGQVLGQVRSAAMLSETTCEPSSMLVMLMVKKLWLKLAAASAAVKARPLTRS